MQRQITSPAALALSLAAASFGSSCVSYSDHSSRREHTSIEVNLMPDTRLNARLNKSRTVIDEVVQERYTLDFYAVVGTYDFTLTSGGATSSWSVSDTPDMEKQLSIEIPSDFVSLQVELKLRYGRNLGGKAEVNRDQMMKWMKELNEFPEMRFFQNR